MDTKTYWKNRKAGKRGQGEAPAPKRYAKGDKIKYTTREGIEAEYPNAQGQNMARVDGRLSMVNRKEARRKTRSHPATKKNFEYQQKKNNFAHTVK